MNAKQCSLAKLFISKLPISLFKKHYLYRTLVENSSFVTLEKALSLLIEKRFFLIISTGRTGTAWISNLLSNKKTIYVPHEPGVFESVAYCEALKHPPSADIYIKKFRVIETAIRGWDFTQVGEVNGLLRRHIEALKNVMPKIKIIHVIRDGRDWVRSVMARSTWTEKDTVYGNTIPSKKIVRMEEWEGMDKFERLCFMWNAENRYMKQFSDSTIRFEDMLSNYFLFKSKILDVIGIDVSEAHWKGSIQKTVNETRVHQFPSYSEWLESNKSIFNKHCEELMKIYKYF